MKRCCRASECVWHDRSGEWKLKNTITVADACSTATCHRIVAAVFTASVFSSSSVPALVNVCVCDCVSDVSLELGHLVCVSGSFSLTISSVFKPLLPAPEAVYVLHASVRTCVRMRLYVSVISPVSVDGFFYQSWSLVNLGQRWTDLVLGSKR